MQIGTDYGPLGIWPDGPRSTVEGLGIARYVLQGLQCTSFEKALYGSDALSW